jgi:alpha-ketoglutarate-dependent taurine dioxygenase
MNGREICRPSLKARLTGVRKAVTMSLDEVVQSHTFEDGGSLPLVIEPSFRKIDLLSWAAANRGNLEASLLKHGGVLLRGFDVPNASEFEAFIKTVSDQLLEYRERSSPRSSVSKNVYTSTDYPADQSIFLHNENSYQRTVNMKIFFFCETPAEKGGETPIADCRKIFQRIEPQVRETFMEKKWMYIRNYGDGFGLPWQTVFQTNDKAVVEAHCRGNDISVEWKDGDRLRTRAVLSAALKHPKSGEMVWFNHATFFHVTTLEGALYRALMAEFKDEDDLPTNACYGDGSRIPSSVLDHLRDVYLKEEVRYPWKKGDILMLDNMMVAHGRAPYTGTRRVLVGMTEPIDRHLL